MLVLSFFLFYITDCWGNWDEGQLKEQVEQGAGQMRQELIVLWVINVSSFVMTNSYIENKQFWETNLRQEVLQPIVEAIVSLGVVGQVQVLSAYPWKNLHLSNNS